MELSFDTLKNSYARGINNYYNLGFEFFAKPCPIPHIEED